MTTNASPTPIEQVVNGAKLVSDFTILPGSSLLVEGKILEGTAHSLLGHVAVRAIGPLGWFLVAANSYSKASSGAGLFEHLSGFVKAKRAKGGATATPEVTATPAPAATEAA